MNRIERISAILVKLQSAPVITAQEIADQFGISIRTVYRDIRSLEESGIPICAEAGTGYSLVEGFKLPPLIFTEEEAISFLMAEKLMLYQTDEETFNVFRSGMNKIRAVLRSADKDILFDLNEYIIVPKVYNSPSPVPANVLQPILKSIRERRQIAIEYTAGYNHETTQRVVEPLGVFFTGGKWYIMAWCLLRCNYRTFHLGRIHAITLQNTDFSKKHKPLHDLINMLYFSTPVTEVIMRTHRDAVRDMGMSKYSFGLYHEETTGEYVKQFYKVGSFENFSRWYIAFADKAEIISPPELLDEVKKRLATLNAVLM